MHRKAETGIHTIPQATDRDIGSGQVVWFEFTTTQVPFIVDRDSGVVTTADVFNGQTGTRYTIPVRAYDNKEYSHPCQLPAH